MIAFLLFSAVYVIFLIWARVFWDRIENSSIQGEDFDLGFTVIIPARNEACNIVSIISDLRELHYPWDKIEVIVVDDNSEDGTIGLAGEALASGNFDYQVLSLADHGLMGKKRAITLGVRHAHHEIILTTDADCRIPKDWLKAYAHAYANQKAVMLTGPVKMQAHNLFTKVQSLEFAALVGVGAVSLKSGNPGMCNGANMSYRKDIFDEVEGYVGNEEIPTGDDEFLLQKVFKRYPNRIFFLKNPAAIVQTPAKENWGTLINQRIRWTSKWKFHKSIYIKLIALFIFFNYFSFLYALTLTFQNTDDLILFAGVLIFRWIGLCLFIIPVARFFKIRAYLFQALLAEIIYPFFVIFLGIASIFGAYSWKGRRY